MRVITWKQASLVEQRVKCLPAVWETWVRSLGQEDPQDKEMATHSGTIAWKIPWMKKPGRHLGTGSQKVLRTLPLVEDQCTVI